MEALPRGGIRLPGAMPFRMLSCYAEDDWRAVASLLHAGTANYVVAHCMVGVHKGAVAMSGMSWEQAKAQVSSKPSKEPALRLGLRERRPSGRRSRAGPKVKEFRASPRSLLHVATAAEAPEVVCHHCRSKEATCWQGLIACG